MQQCYTSKNEKRDQEISQWSAMLNMAFLVASMVKHVNCLLMEESTEFFSFNAKIYVLYYPLLAPLLS